MTDGAKKTMGNGESRPDPADTSPPLHHRAGPARLVRRLGVGDAVVIGLGRCSVPVPSGPLTGRRRSRARACCSGWP